MSLRIVASLAFVITGLLLIFYPQIEKEASDSRQEKLIQSNTKQKMML